PASSLLCTPALHDALPICSSHQPESVQPPLKSCESCKTPFLPLHFSHSASSSSLDETHPPIRHSSFVIRHFYLVPTWKSFLPPSDRKSTRLNSSHVKISYA